MLTSEQNRRLTEVEGQAPMGRMMRQRSWIPCALSEQLQPDGAPRLIQVLGERYIAFRATDGRVGVLDEACPHRRVSLLLARNEGCGLRCLFHGWKIDVSGNVVEVPSEGARSHNFSRRIKVNSYPSFEGGGLLWVYLGTGAPPPRPALPFLDLPKENMFIGVSTIPCNWFQGIEGALDSAHIGVLHQSWLHNLGESAMWNYVPRYEAQATSYGMRAAAIRELADEERYIRISEWVMPFCAMHPSGRNGESGVAHIVVPIDNVSYMFFMGLWNEKGPYNRAGEESLRAEERAIDAYALVKGDRRRAWNQNRTAMANGHFTGFDKCLMDEDVIVQVSMGEIANRTKEQLCPSDLAVVRARQRILRELSAFEEGGVEVNYPDNIIRPIDLITPAGYAWNEEFLKDRSSHPESDTLIKMVSDGAT